MTNETQDTEFTTAIRKTFIDNASFGDVWTPQSFELLAGWPEKTGRLEPLEGKQSAFEHTRNCIAVDCEIVGVAWMTWPAPYSADVSVCGKIDLIQAAASALMNDKVKDPLRFHGKSFNERGVDAVKKFTTQYGWDNCGGEAEHLHRTPDGRVFGSRKALAVLLWFLAPNAFPSSIPMPDDYGRGNARLS